LRILQPRVPDAVLRFLSDAPQIRGMFCGPRITDAADLTFAWCRREILS